MKHLSFAALLFFSVNSLFAQAPLSAEQIQPTGGCAAGYNMTILNVTHNDKPVFVLVNKQKYAVAVRLVPVESICGGDLFAILNNGVSGWQVGYLPGATTGDYIIPIDPFDLKPGVYDLVIKFTTYNDPTVSAKISVLETTGIKEVNETSGINIFPDPANDLLVIDHTTFAKQIETISITDMNGRQVRTIHPEHGAHTTRINVSELPAGMYTAQLQSADDVIYRKVAIVH